MLQHPDNTFPRAPSRPSTTDSHYARRDSKIFSDGVDGVGVFGFLVGAVGRTLAKRSAIHAEKVFWHCSPISRRRRQRMTSSTEASRCSTSRDGVSTRPAVLSRFQDGGVR